MAKSKTIQRKVLKINSEDIRNFTEYSFSLEKEKCEFKDYIWRYEIKTNTPKERIINADKLISLGESATLRFLDGIIGQDDITEKYNEYKKMKKIITHGGKITGEYKDKNIKWFNEQIFSLQFQKNYIMIVFKNKEDFKHINKGLTVNGMKFKRLYGTSGSLKNNTVVYVSNEKVDKEDSLTIYDKLLEKLENSVNKNIKLIPSKYEAYLSLNSSASTPIDFKISHKNILVTQDHVVNFKTKVTEINRCIGDKTNIKEVDDYDIHLSQVDGCGCVTPELASQFAKCVGVEDYIPSGMIIRNSFLKGVIFPFKIAEFIEKYAKDKDEILDAWENPVKVKDIQMIIPVSMLKLWNGYNSIKHYCECCEKNGHNFAITKVIERELESERTMNYQFLSSLDLNKEDVYKLIEPTIIEIKEILGGDYRKSILYSKGKYVNEANVDRVDADFLKAIMVDERMINDPHIRKGIHNMLKSGIDRAKIGKIKVKSNYSLISGSIFEYLEEVFDVKEKQGLLKSGEFYSGYWNKQNVTEVAAFRAPACTHANFRVLKLKQNKELDYWYEYMQNCVIFNCHDSTCESLSGADKD